MRKLVGGIVSLLVAVSAILTILAYFHIWISVPEFGVPPAVTAHSPVVITENRQVRETGGHSNGTGIIADVTVDTVAIDKVDTAMVWTFTLTNPSGGAGSAHFDKCQLADLASGNTWDAGGQISKALNLGPGQSEDLTGTFAFAPTTGTKYTLSIQVNGYDYQDASFTF
jgi:hypothetical protein